MTTPPNIKTCYQLPFEVMHSPLPLMSLGQNVIIRIYTSTQDIQAAAQDYQSCLTAFIMLSTTGALCGTKIPPQEACIQDHTPAKIMDNYIQWECLNCKLDENSIPIFAQMLTNSHEKYPVVKIEIENRSRKGLMSKLLTDPKYSPYPQIYEHLTFPFIIDEDAFESPTLSVVFRNHLDAQTQDLVNTEILTWASACMLGAYGVAPIDPYSCTLLSGDVLFVTSNEMEFAMKKFRAHPNALNGLINVCGAIDSNFAKIANLTIE